MSNGSPDRVRILPESVSPQAVIATLGTAACLSVVIFYLDISSATESAVAVLYSVAVLIAAQALGRSGILFAGAISCAASVFTFFLSHQLESNIHDLVRLFVTLIAVCTTTGILAGRNRSNERLLQANQSLRRIESRFRAVFERSRMALWEQDFTKLEDRLAELKKQGVTDIREYAAANPTFLRECSDLIETVEVNEATLQLLEQRSGEDMKGSVTRFLPNGECALEGVVNLFEDRRYFEETIKLIKSDGSVISVFYALCFPDAPERLERVVSAMLDVTQRDLAQKMLMTAQSEMARAARVTTVGALSASIAHELNQPIGALVLNAQSCLRWLRHDPPDLTSASDAAERIVRDSHRAASILKSTRELMLRNPAEPEPVELVDLIGETCLAMEQEFANASIVLQTKMPSRLPLIRAVRLEIQQVLVNLLNNAIQAIGDSSPRGRKVMIECAMDGHSTLRLTVRDHGPGIEESNISHVFDSFFSTKPSGMGIGLSICKSIIETQGGRLTAWNHPDGGAVFEVFLPIEMAADATPASEEASYRGDLIA